MVLSDQSEALVRGRMRALSRRRHAAAYCTVPPRSGGGEDEDEGGGEGEGEGDCEGWQCEGCGVLRLMRQGRLDFAALDACQPE